MKQEEEDRLLREVALQNAQSIYLARQRAEEELVRTKRELEDRSNELARSVALMRATLDATTNGILVTGAAGRVAEINARFAEMWAFPAELIATRDHRALIGHSAKQFADPAAFLRRVEEIYATQPAETYDLLELADGRVIERFSRTQDVDGERQGRVWSFRDITVHKQAQDKLRRQSEWLRVTLASIGDAVITTDSEGRITSMNPVAIELTGWPHDDALGRPLEQVFHIVNEETRRPVENPARRALLDGQIVGLANHTVLIARDRSERAIDDSAAPIRDDRGHVLGVVLIFRDITARREDERRLRQSEAQFRQLADALPQMVWTARADGFVDWYNERWYEFSGFARDALGDDSWTPIVHPDDVQRAVNTYYHCINTGVVYQIEFRFKDRRTSGFRWYLGRAYPIRGEHGDIIRWFGTFTDIHDTKRASETTRFLADASAALAELSDYETMLQRVAALAVPAFADWCAADMLDVDGSVRRVAVTHVEPTKVQLAFDLQQRWPPAPSDQHGAMNVLRTGEPEWAALIPDELLSDIAHDADHLSVIRALGLKSYISIPLRSRDRIIGVLSFVTAESGRVYEDSDIAVALDLAARASIAIDNAHLLGALTEADRRKDEFLAILAHELRNPLAPIINALQILRAKAPPIPEITWATDVIDRQARHSARLVDDLMDVSRITRGKIALRIETIDLAAVINGAVEASRPLIDQRKHVLTVELPREPVMLRGDLTRLSQVFLNLLNNAAKYTDPGGMIWVTAEKSGSTAIVRVKDTGMGIQADMLPRVFELFTQADRSLERAHGGLGIGLTLVRRLVELHGGRVDAFSAGPGHGSEFVVHLPLGSGAGAPAAETPRA
jgi:PAS domain S-box-containing protein